MDLQALNQPLPLNISGYDDSPHYENILHGESPSAPSPPENLFDDQSFSSPMVSQNQLLSPSPTSIEIASNMMDSLEGEPPAFGGYLSDNAPEILPLQNSPAYGLWPQIPTPAPTFGPKAEPPVAPEFSEDDNPMSFPPSSMMAKESKLTSPDKNELSVTNIEEEKSKLLDHLPVVLPEDLDRIMETVPEELGHSNDRT